MVSLKVHNILDYVIAFILTAAPFVFNFSQILIARNIFIILGVALFAYGLITKYYYCIARLIPLGVHMCFDVSAGVILCAAPFAFDYKENLTPLQLAVHFLLGLGAVGHVSMTKTKTEADKTIQEGEETSGTHFNHPHRV